MDSRLQNSPGLGVPVLEHDFGGTPRTFNSVNTTQHVVHVRLFTKPRTSVFYRIQGHAGLQAQELAWRRVHVIL